MDLLQEKNIKRLKKMAQRHDADFGGTFFQEIVALNVRAFIQVTDTMKSAVQLAEKGGTHRRKKKVAAIKELAMEMQDRQLHRFRRGRTLGHKASDDFENGYLIFANIKRIPDFISRTLKDAGTIHRDGDMEPDSPDDFEDAPMPNMVIGGSLVAGDELDRAGEGEASQMEDMIMRHLFDRKGGEIDDDSDSSSDIDD